jgi:hypothetical protein
MDFQDKSLIEFFKSKHPKRVVSLIRRGHDAACACCNSLENLTFDHIIPIALGGSNKLENGQILCKSCNVVKGSWIIFLEDLKMKILGHEVPQSKEKPKTSINLKTKEHTKFISRDDGCGIFLVAPYSWSYQRKHGVEYIEASKVENGIGYFTKNDAGWHCKTVNKIYRRGNILVEKRTYDKS